MGNDVITVADGFWNFRGSYRIGGIIDVGTQSALVRLKSGHFVLLDSYTLGHSARRMVAEQTDGGEKLEAVINLHPFHTIHVEAIHGMYPLALHYGTARHHEIFPHLNWEEMPSEDVALHDYYADDFEFTVPRGVDFISADEKVHFSSVLAYHRASKTIYSDDTLVYLSLPQLARWFGLGDDVSFHPTLAKALERRAGAAQDFRDWAAGLVDNWGGARNLCAAHTASLLAAGNRGDSIRERLERALRRAEKTLSAHVQQYG